MKRFYPYFILCVLIVRVVWVMSDLPPLEFKEKINKKIEGSGVVTVEPDKRENSQRIVVGNKILFTISPYINVSFGDKIEFSGVLKVPENFKTDAGVEFDYVHFLAKDGIYYEMYFPKIEVVSHRNGNEVIGFLLSLKHSLLEHLATIIPEPELSLLGGLLLGVKQSLGKGLLDDFKKTGVIHMVVISGYNISIVAEAIMRSFSFLPTAFRFLFSSCGIILFVLMTGASGASVRAGIMVLIVLLGKILGRTYSPIRALLFAATCMVIHNPMILLYDPSFQLSFLATLGLLLVSPLLLPYLMIVPERFGLREMVSATVSIQVFLLPYLLYLSGSLSVVSLPVNLLVLFLIPVTMLVGFIVGMLSFFPF